MAAQNLEGMEAAFNFWVVEPWRTSIEAQRMYADICATWWSKMGRIDVRDETPVLLVPGAGAGSLDLELTKWWYRIVAGFPNTFVSQTGTRGEIEPQVQALIDEVNEFGQPIHVVGISAGGTKAIAAACLEPNPFKTVAIVDAPINPMEERHFNSQMRRFSVNDLLGNIPMMDHLQRDIPEGVRILSFPGRNHGVFDRELTRRPNVPVFELPVDGHHNLYYNVTAHRIIADALCPQASAA